MPGQLIEVRRDLHAHPELSWAEERTTALLAKRLDEAGLVPTVLPRQGLVVDIGSGDGPVVALRADLDALPVEDRTTTPGPAPSAASRTPAATTCTPPRCWAPGWRCPRSPTSCRAGCGSSSSRPRRSCPAAR